jgi:hypothetical protein
MLTLARLAASITEMNCDCTLGGIDRPSEKKTTLLRPGTDLRALTIARSELEVA